MRAPKAILLDLNGTLHIEDGPTRDAVAALAKLYEHFPIRFVTNTTKESSNTLYNRLVSIGFEIKQEEIFTSLVATKKLLKSRSSRPLLFLEPDALEEFADLDCSNPNSVVIGLSPSNFNYDKLNQAYSIIESGGDFIAIHKAKYYKTSKNMELGPGCFVVGLEYSTGKKSTVVGKPSKSFYQLVIDDLGVSFEDVVMIGDSVTDDCLGAIELGMQAILVKTGKYKAGDELQCPTTFDDFASAVEHLVRLKKE
ncbi:Haloacid dehalogenase-like hydrolase domain-containing protein 2 [Boothiomyces sp. JEL0838]|nr:Haloacid dehalogenase-like hydrolase domain-containing protein 2 [Boothiomyces sp. JEL0838]